MNNATQLLDYELRRNHSAVLATGLTGQDRARTDLLSARRQTRRRRMAQRVRAVADRLDA
ncbi:hypothetical protein FE634_22160 [Nocardioides dongxiaopingii]|uniref:hypothetical protein n=1 Tax=Nocardioides TaxID=1839 RepID=UPI0010C76FBB|nr:MULTISPECIES: hypothetical protein [Nocardioides]QDH11186.1 hypothetical protein FE634_22160 [Nocardioides sp. S-1144]